MVIQRLVVSALRGRHESVLGRLLGLHGRVASVLGRRVRSRVVGGSSSVGIGMNRRSRRVGGRLVGDCLGNRDIRDGHSGLEVGQRNGTGGGAVGDRRAIGAEATLEVALVAGGCRGQRRIGASERALSGAKVGVGVGHLIINPLLEGAVVAVVCYGVLVVLSGLRVY